MELGILPNILTTGAPTLWSTLPHVTSMEYESSTPVMVLACVASAEGRLINAGGNHVMIFDLHYCQQYCMDNNYAKWSMPGETDRVHTASIRNTEYTG